MFLALLLQLVAPGPADLMARASSRLTVDTPPPPSDRRYRVEGDVSVVDDKRAALETTGGQCQVVGARMCQRRPRTLMRAPLLR